MAATATQRTKSTIHVSSLPTETTKELLLAAFIPFGEIVDIQIPVNEEGKLCIIRGALMNITHSRQFHTWLRIHRV